MTEGPYQAHPWNSAPPTAAARNDLHGDLRVWGVNLQHLECLVTYSKNKSRIAQILRCDLKRGCGLMVVQKIDMHAFSLACLETWSQATLCHQKT